MSILTSDLTLPSTYPFEFDTFLRRASDPFEQASSSHIYIPPAETSDPFEFTFTPPDTAPLYPCKSGVVEDEVPADLNSSSTGFSGYFEDGVDLLYAEHGYHTDMYAYPDDMLNAYRGLGGVREPHSEDEDVEVYDCNEDEDEDEGFSESPKLDEQSSSPDDESNPGLSSPDRSEISPEAAELHEPFFSSDNHLHLPFNVNMWADDDYALNPPTSEVASHIDSIPMLVDSALPAHPPSCARAPTPQQVTKRKRQTSSRSGLSNKIIKRSVAQCVTDGIQEDGNSDSDPNDGAWDPQAQTGRTKGPRSATRPCRSRVTKATDVPPAKTQPLQHPYLSEPKCRELQKDPSTAQEFEDRFNRPINWRIDQGSLKIKPKGTQSRDSDEDKEVLWALEMHFNPNRQRSSRNEPTRKPGTKYSPAMTATTVSIWVGPGWENFRGNLLLSWDPSHKRVPEDFVMADHPLAALLYDSLDGAKIAQKANIGNPFQRKTKAGPCPYYHCSDKSFSCELGGQSFLKETDRSFRKHIVSHWSGLGYCYICPACKESALGDRGDNSGRHFRACEGAKLLGPATFRKLYKASRWLRVFESPVTSALAAEQQQLMRQSNYESLEDQYLRLRRDRLNALVAERRQALRSTSQ